MKKLLALVLALVMTMSLVTISNAAYSDAADIDYTEAVEVMSAAGILAGSDGKFDPDGILTREQAAKIIAYMRLGKTAADGLSAASAPFVDVPANRWSAGAISYCVSEGIIAGVGDGKFDPTGTLTGYQFAKMLLVALGYDPAIEGFTGADWAINVAKVMLSIELNDGITSTVLSNGITRQEAAQMALNTLTANRVEYNGGVNVNTPDGTSIKVGATRSYVRNASLDAVAFMDTYQTKLTLATTSSDKYGHPANLWSWDGKEVGKYTNKSAKYTWTADLTDSDDTTVADALDGYTFKAGATDSVNTVYTNGIPTQVDLSASQIKALTDNGTKVEVYVSKNVVNRVVVTETVLAKITDKDVDDKSVTVSYNDGHNDIPVTINDKTTDSKLKDAYAALYAMSVKDEVLLVATDNGTSITAILDVAEPTTVTGQYTALKSSKYTVGGTAYGLSANGTAPATLGNDYTLTLDKYGYIIGTGNVESSKTYAFILDGSTDGTAKAGYTYNAKLLFTDGTMAWAEVASFNNSKEGADIKAAIGASNATHVKDFVSYTKNSDGTYALSTSGLTTDDLQSKDITKNDTSYNSKTVTNKTVYAIYNKASKTYAVYTGVKNVPNTNVGDDANETFGLLKSGVYSFIVVTDPVGTTASDAVYIYNATASGSEYINSETVKTYKAIVNGKKTTIQVSDSSFNSNASAGMKVGSTYDGDIVTTVGSDVASGNTISAAKSFSKTNDADKLYKATSAATDKLKLDQGVLTFDATNDVTGLVADDFTCFVVDASASSVKTKTLSDTAWALGETGSVYFSINADGEIAYVIVVA